MVHLFPVFFCEIYLVDVTVLWKSVESYKRLYSEIILFIYIIYLIYIIHVCLSVCACDNVCLVYNNRIQLLRGRLVKRVYLYQIIQT